MGVIVLLVVSGTIVLVMRTNHTSPTPAASSDRDAVVSWWTHARDDFTTLQNAIDQIKRGLSQYDETAMKSGCRLMHDTAGVTLEAKMPTPDPELTAEVQGMIGDFQEASHMCLSAAAGSLNNYSGEFRSYLEQAEIQMHAAEDKAARLTQA